MAQFCLLRQLNKQHDSEKGLPFAYQSVHSTSMLHQRWVTVYTLSQPTHILWNFTIANITMRLQERNLLDHG